MVSLTAHQTLAILAGIVGFVLIAWILVSSAGRDRSKLMNFNRDFFFWLSITYLALLLVAAGMYMGNFYGVKDRIPVILGGILPIGVPWFGAVGAVVISLEGVFQHTQEGNWDDRYSYWHMARPLFGAVLAIVAFFIFLLLIGATGQTPAFATPGGDSQASDLIVYYVVAFLVGYREETFRELVKRVTDLLFVKTQQPPGSGLPAVTFEAHGSGIERVDFGPVAGGGAAVATTLSISNTGPAALTAPVAIVTTDNALGGGPFSKGNDRVSSHGDLAPGETRTLEVLFSPPAGDPKPFAGKLTVSSAALPVPADISLSGAAV